MIQMNINHREILQELNNWSNWPQNLWLAGDNEHLQVQIESLKRLCLVRVNVDTVGHRIPNRPVFEWSFFGHFIVRFSNSRQDRFGMNKIFFYDPY
jgi:hypothetical protein